MLEMLRCGSRPCLVFDEQLRFSMKFLILHVNGVWACEIMVSELLVTALGLDGQETIQEYPTLWYQSCGLQHWAWMGRGSVNQRSRLQHWA